MFTCVFILSCVFILMFVCVCVSLSLSLFFFFFFPQLKVFMNASNGFACCGIIKFY